MRLCKRVKNSDVEVGLLAISSPEVCCNNIEAGAFFSVGCSVAQLLSGDWLKVRFSADIVAYFLHHFFRVGVSFSLISPSVGGVSMLRVTTYVRSAAAKVPRNVHRRKYDPICIVHPQCKLYNWIPIHV